MEVKIGNIRHEVPIRITPTAEESPRSTVIFAGQNHLFADELNAKDLQVILRYWCLDPAERETCEFWLAMKTMAEAARK